ncbi:hypothetical protein [Nonomuraea salmonea]|uniref:hypothetical protein n=1 Tax=Nonomuraea salmonea TaxID=46181 RepID=UPI002FE9BC13
MGHAALRRPPIPDEEPEPPKGRRPYSSPTAEPDVEPRRRPRRVVNRPDKLVAGGPLSGERPGQESRPGREQSGQERRPGEVTQPLAAAPGVPVQEAPAQDSPVQKAPAQDAPAQGRGETRGEDRPPLSAGEARGEDRPPLSAGEARGADRPPLSGGEARGEDRPPLSGGEAGARADREPPPYRLVYPIPSRDTPPEQESGEEEVRRVGRPPAGRPTRPDLLVAAGPARPQGGRHHRGPAPSAIRRAGPVRRGSRAVPVVLTVAAAMLVATGVLVWQWAGDEAPALRLEAGTGRSGDELFTVPAAGDGVNQKLNDMTSVGKAVVAVGSDTTSPTPRPLFLFSPDGGKRWQLGQVNGTSATPTVRRVVGGDGRWLASGGDETTGERGLWTSTDGYSWTAVPSSRLGAFKDGDQIADIARTKSGFVAVGRTRGAGGGPGGGTAPAAWRSADGAAWERAELSEPGVRELRAVVAKGDTVVAIGVPADGEGSRVLRSADGGRAWQATGFQLPEAADPRAGTVAALPERFVLVPTRRRTVEGDVRVYCSPTGAQWSQCGSIRGLDAASTGVESLIAYPSGVAAIAPAGIGGYSVLTSSDGRDWDKRADLGDLTGATLRGFTIAEGGTLFAGGDRAASDVDNQLVLMAAPQRGSATQVRLGDVEGLTRMARETNALAAYDGRYVAVGSASGDAGLWTIRNWQSWKSMSLGGPGRQTLEDVAHGARGWLAVGGTQTNVSLTDPLLVTSQDGENWKRVNVTGDLARPPRTTPTCGPTSSPRARRATWWPARRATRRA